MGKIKYLPFDGAYDLIVALKKVSEAWSKNIEQVKSNCESANIKYSIMGDLIGVDMVNLPDGMTRDEASKIAFSNNTYVEDVLKQLNVISKDDSQSI